MKDIKREREREREREKLQKKEKGDTLIWKYNDSYSRKVEREKQLLFLITNL